MSKPKGLFAGFFTPSARKAETSRAHKSDKKNVVLKKPVRKRAGRVWRGAMVGLGAFIVVLGIVIAPLPGPFGMPISLGGLILVMRNSYWAKRQFVKSYRRYPKWLSPVRRLLRPRARVVSIIWQQMLRTEKLVINRTRDRVLGPMRRRFLRKARRHGFTMQSAK